MQQEVLNIASRVKRFKLDSNLGTSNKTRNYSKPLGERGGDVILDPSLSDLSRA